MIQGGSGVWNAFERPNSMMHGPACEEREHAADERGRSTDKGAPTTRCRHC